MTKILCEGDFVEQVGALVSVPFNLTSSRGKPTLEQTKRNKVRGELLDGLAKYLDAILDGTSASVYRVSEGVAIEIANDGVYQSEQAGGLGDTTNGTIVLTMDLTMQNLEYDAYQAAIEWDEDVKAKEAAAAIRAEKLAAKEARKQAAAARQLGGKNISDEVAADANKVDDAAVVESSNN